jgi:aspartate aminotransferase
MSLSRIGRSIRVSPTLALNQRAAILREEGEHVIHFGIGEPKSKAPIEALAAAHTLLDTGEVRYAPAEGVPTLKAAIIRYTDEWYGHRITPANVIPCSGAKQAIMVALQAILDPGEEVILPAPYWVSYPEMARLCRATPVPAPTEHGTFQPRIGDIERRVSPRTKAVIVNSPNNPSGAVYSEEFIHDVVRFCERSGLWLIMDDIYHRLVFDGYEWTSPTAHATDHGDDSRLILINGVSKQYAMTGFRIGWAVGNPKVIEAMVNMQSHQTSGPSVLLQKASAAAIDGDQSNVEALRLSLQKNRNLMFDQLRSIDGVTVEEPGGTFYCFADFSAFDESSRHLAEFLLDKVHVVTVPGVEFGVEGYLRFSCCGAPEDIETGIERIRSALAQRR